jgi:pimeloyl-ACP methyl ester carboxylesterase
MPRLVKWGAGVVLALAGLVVVALAGAIVFGTAPPPPPLATVRAAAAQIEREGVDAPPPRRFVARDGSTLAYRAYPAAPDRVAIVVHGSSGSSLGVHGLARALQAAGITVYAPDVRGHGESGRKGDIDYVGQLDDDLVDLLAALEPPPPGGKRLLAGFSAGGGFVLRVAGGPAGERFDGYLLLAPMVAFDSPTSNPWGDRWAAPSIPRIVALAMLSRVGIHWFEHLPVIAFAIAPQEVDARRTPAYSFRLWANFGSRRDWRADIRRIRRPARVLIGEQDELFFADQYAPTFHAVRRDIAIEVLPGLDHAGPVVSPAGRAAVVRALTTLFTTPP